jgi:hypothetical protein
MSIWIYTYPATRVVGAQQDAFHAQSIVLTTSWGSSPASATVTYVTARAGAHSIAVGQILNITGGGHSFWGLCKSDTDDTGSDGRKRTLQFVDLREFLTHDLVYGAWNMTERRMFNGVYAKWWWHIYPHHFNTMTKTYTNVPLRAADIINSMMSSETVQCPWFRLYHRYQVEAITETSGMPVYEVDCLSGKTLAAALVEVSERQGLVFGLFSTAAAPYTLAWVQKGGALPTYANNTVFPPNSDQQRLGIALSGHAQRIRVLGGRNLYQVMNVELVPNWNRAWEFFLVPEKLVDFIYLTAVDPRTGVRLTAISPDPDHTIGYQLAASIAGVITVGELIALRNSANTGAAATLYTTIPTGASLVDTRLFSGRSRMDMPASLYISQLLFRAWTVPTTSYRLNGLGQTLPVFALVNHAGRTVPIESLTIEPRLLARVTHNPNPSAFSGNNILSADTADLADGNGYAIAQGYNVMQTAFENFRPDQFNIAKWQDLQNVWAQVQFQIDDSGEGVPFIIFDAPVFHSVDLIKKDVETNWYAVKIAFPTITVPRVLAALTFAAENFSRVYPVDSPAVVRDQVVNVNGLNGEYVLNALNRWVELPYADGFYTEFKAQQIAYPLLNHTPTYAEGGYRVQGSNTTQLSNVIDRVTLNISSTGMTEDVEFTSEATENAFVPERELDRRIQLEKLIPGQEELRSRSREQELVGRAFQQSPIAMKTLIEELRGPVGPFPPLGIVRVA